MISGTAHTKESQVIKSSNLEPNVALRLKDVMRKEFPWKHELKNWDSLVSTEVTIDDFKSHFDAQLRWSLNEVYSGTTEMPFQMFFTRELLVYGHFSELRKIVFAKDTNGLRYKEGAQHHLLGVRKTNNISEIVYKAAVINSFYALKSPRQNKSLMFSIVLQDGTDITCFVPRNTDNQKRELKRTLDFLEGNWKVKALEGLEQLAIGEKWKMNPGFSRTIPLDAFKNMLSD